MKLLYALFTFLTVGSLLLFFDVKEVATFEAEVDDELKAAAFAADIPSAKAHLDKAVAYLEKERYTEGSTHFLWYGATDDVGVWYKRLKKAQGMLGNFERSQGEISHQEMTVWDTQVLGHLRSMLVKVEKSEVRRPNTVWNLHHKWGGLFLTISWILSAAGALICGIWKAAKS